MARRGPKTQEGRERSLANLNQYRKEKPAHGVYTFISSGLLPPCSKCAVRMDCKAFTPEGNCTILPAIREERKRKLLELPYLQPQDEALVELLLDQYTVLDLISLFVAKQGPLVKDSKAGLWQWQPVMDRQSQAVRMVADLLNQLGVGPAARKRLGLDADKVLDLAAMFASSDGEGGEISEDNTGDN